MTTLSFKVSEDEARTIRARARQERLTVSEFLRRQAIVPARPLTKIELIPCALTGAIVFAGGDNLSPLTVESTKTMLADFP